MICEKTLWPQKKTILMKLAVVSAHPRQVARWIIMETASSNNISLWGRTWKLHLSVDARRHPFPPAVTRTHFRLKGCVCVCAKKEIGPRYKYWGVIGPSGPKSISPPFFSNFMMCSETRERVGVLCHFLWRHRARIEPREGDTSQNRLIQNLAARR